MIQLNDISNGIFRHKCEVDNCSYHVIYDDEPYCYKHSEDSGSSVYGYSAYKNRPMHGVKFNCYFLDWNGFMDGSLTIGDETCDLDFVSVNNQDSDEEIVLDPFTEESARAWFKDKGYDNVQFIY